MRTQNTRVKHSLTMIKEESHHFLFYLQVSDISAVRFSSALTCFALVQSRIKSTVESNFIQVCMTLQSAKQNTNSVTKFELY